jgi:hypothetical protein
MAPAIQIHLKLVAVQLKCDTHEVKNKSGVQPEKAKKSIVPLRRDSLKQIKHPATP